MKKSVFWGAAVALAAIVPGVASAEMNGYAGASYGWVNGDTSAEALSSWHGGFTAPLYGNWQFQFDGSSVDLDHDSHTHPFGSVQGHAFLRNDSHSFGVFASSLNIDGSNFYGLGAEGALYFNNFTWSGQVGWATPTYDNPDEVWNIGTQGTWFVSDNFTIGAELSYTDTEYYGEEITSYGVNAEYQFTGSPFSATLGWVQGDTDYDSGGSQDADIVMIGGRLNFGTSDLRDRDRNGASFMGLVNVIRDHTLGF